MSTGFGLSEQDVRLHIWNKWLPLALSSGQMQCLPPAEIVGEGIEKVSYACEIPREGVSGKKIVVKVC